MTERRFAIPDETAEVDEGFALDSELRDDVPLILQEAEIAGPPARGRLEPGSVTYDDVREEYLGSTPVQLRDLHRPPAEWTATDDEMRQVVSWTNARLTMQDRVRADNTYRFLVTYAAHRNKSISRLQTGTAAPRGAFRREEENNFRWMQTAGELERSQTGATEAAIGGGPSPRPPPDLPATPSVLGGPPPPPPRFDRRPGETDEEARDRADADSTIEGREVETSRDRTRMNERERLARISGWFERPEILGMQGLDDEVYGHVEAAFVDLKRRHRQFSEVSDPNVFVNTDVVEVRNMFARLAANLAAITDFFNAPVTALDRNRERLQLANEDLYRALNRWTYDPINSTFVERSESSLNSEHVQGFALPSMRRSRGFGFGIGFGGARSSSIF